jgi:two-component system, OmpR family, sensor kinase
MSLKARLLLGVGLIALLLVVAAVAVEQTTSSYLNTKLDEQLALLARPPGVGQALPPDISTTAERLPSDQVPGTQPSPSLTTLYAGTFIDGSLTTTIRPFTGSGSTAQPQVSESDAQRLAEDSSFTDASTTSGGGAYRITARADQTGRIVVFGIPRGDVDTTIQRLVTVEVITCALILLVLGIITWWVLRLGVRPIRKMTVAATGIADGDLQARIPYAAKGTEAGDLGIALNRMLEQIESAFETQAHTEQQLRRFIGDASHELRTPITTIRGYAELYRTGGLADSDTLDSAMLRTESEATRMGSLIEDMLDLARLDQGIHRPFEPVDLDRVVASAVSDAIVSNSRNRFQVDIEPAIVSGDPDQLFQVVSNLLLNAVMHGGQNGHILVTVREQEGTATLAVEDQGPGMKADDVARAFERFYRADESRSRTSGGSGLGLSIVKAIVDAHHGHVMIESPAAPSTSGTRVLVMLPTSP